MCIINYNFFSIIFFKTLYSYIQREIVSYYFYYLLFLNSYVKSNNYYWTEEVIKLLKYFILQLWSLKNFPFPKTGRILFNLCIGNNHIYIFFNFLFQSMGAKQSQLKCLINVHRFNHKKRLNKYFFSFHIIWSVLILYVI